jgi:Asp-tRNA(Asn)/Glu-tRNA(Gln) amidotransferase A subunit family amidase
MLAAVAGFDRRDRHSLPPVRLDVPAPPLADLRVVVSEDLGFAPVDDDVRRSFGLAVDRLADSGVQVVEDSPQLDTSVHTWSAIALAEAHVSEHDEFVHHHADLGEDAAQYIAAGGYVTAGQYIEAQFARERIHRAYVDMFDRTGASVLLTPTLGCEAFPLGQRHPDSVGGVPVQLPELDWAPFLYDANLAGLPACALPIGLGDDGLPVSIHVLGRRCDDGLVLAAAQTIEQVIGFDARPPAGPSPTR